MKQTLILTGALGLFLTVGCGGNSGDALMKERIAAVNEMSDVLGTIKDPASAKEAEPKVKKIKDRLADIDQRWAKLSKSEQEEAVKKYGPELAQAEAAFALKQMNTAVGGLKQLGEGLSGLGDQINKDVGQNIPKDFGKDFPKP
jgi:hypothetical protein